MSEEKKVIIDVSNALLVLRRKTGKVHTYIDLAEKFGVSTPTLHNWNKECPMQVKFVLFLMEHTGMKFEDIVREI